MAKMSKARAAANEAELELKRQQLMENMVAAATALRNASDSLQAFAETTALVDFQDLQAILGTLKHSSEPELSAAENKKRKRKEAKAAKDPNVPKKPSTAYLTYQNEMKTQVVEDNKDKGLKYTDILRIIADKWKNLPEEAKKEYTDKQHDDMETYKANLANYNRAKKAAEGGFPLDDATMEVPEDQVDEDDEEIDEIDQAQEKSDSETDEESVESEPEVAPKEPTPPPVKKQKPSSKKATSALGSVVSALTGAVAGKPDEDHAAAVAVKEKKAKKTEGKEKKKKAE